VRGIIDANFYAEHLVNALLACLYVARKKFRLLIDLLDNAIEGLLLKWVNVNFRFLADGKLYSVPFLEHRCGRKSDRSRAKSRRACSAR